MLDYETIERDLFICEKQSKLRGLNRTSEWASELRCSLNRQQSDDNNVSHATDIDQSDDKNPPRGNTDNSQRDPRSRFSRNHLFIYNTIKDPPVGGIFRTNQRRRVI